MERTLSCPHCGGQMNSIGKGTTAGTVRYFCLCCATPLQNKELFLAQVIRMGAKGFGFLAVDALPHLGDVYFPVAAVRGEAVQVGDRVLLSLENGPNGSAYARAVYKGVPPRTVPNHQTQSGRIPTNRPSMERRWATVKNLEAADWGWLEDVETGKRIFVHASNCKGRVLRVGQRVTYTPMTTPRGIAAGNVTAA